MKRPAWMIPSIAVLATGALSAPAQAQTYDPHYPVCIQTYSINGSYIGCGFTSMDQCRASASGRAAQCFANPYYGAAQIRRRGRAY